MDFHGLARRQLQALCKMNKIPANMTNLAMADALSALENVEGKEEAMQQQSPEKGDVGSPEVPRTVTRTSTRARKPPVSVMESGGFLLQSRARTSRKLADDDTKVEDEKDVANTPALAGSRKKAVVPSGQKVYSTRRSVRLVEKQLSELCLGESKRRTQAIKIDNELLSEMTESDVRGDNLAEVSNETSLKEAIYDEVSSKVSAQVVETSGTACVAKGYEVASNVSSANPDSVSFLEQKVELVAKTRTENFSEMKDEAVDALEDSTDDFNGQEQMEIVKSGNDTMEVCNNSEPELIKVEKKLDAQCQESKETTDPVKVSAPETENVGKENNVIAPKKQLKDLSMGELRKMLGMKISNTSNKNNEGDGNKHQDTPRPTRNALETLPDNTQV